MSEVSQLSNKDLSYKPSLTATRKIGGRIVRVELDPPTMNDEDGLEGLLQGIEGYEIEEGTDRLMRENPQMASMQIHDMLGIDLDNGADEVAQSFADPVRIASSRRVGKIIDIQSKETLNFKRMAGGSFVELTDNNGQMIQKLSNREFDDVLRSGGFDIM